MQRIWQDDDTLHDEYWVYYSADMLVDGWGPSDCWMMVI